MQRSAVSIPSNIAEGYERTDKDFIRFLSIAKGSAAERCTQAYIAAKVRILSTDQMNHIVDETKQLRREMHALANSRKEGSRNPEP
jgi:four helix bundle protein